MRLGAFLILGIVVWSCMTESSNEISVFNFSYNFDESPYDWSGGASDYSVRDTANIKFDLRYAMMPEKPEPAQHTLILSGNNIGDYLTLFIKKQITGLKPKTDYTLAFDIELACDAENKALQNVILKAGATDKEPNTIEKNQYYRLNIDNGAYAESGVDMIVVDTVGVNSNAAEYGVIQPGDAPSTYRYVTARTGDAGSLWVIIATESSGNGRSFVYFTKVAITFSASNK